MKKIIVRKPRPYSYITWSLLSSEHLPGDDDKADVMLVKFMNSLEELFGGRLGAIRFGHVVVGHPALRRVPSVRTARPRHL